MNKITRRMFLGALGGVGPYDLGLYETRAGPLYITSGVGALDPAVRFFCRPEIVLFEI